MSAEQKGRADVRSGSSAAAIAHTGFGDCACYECWPPEPDYPLADHGKPLNLWWSLWAVLKGVRLYGR